MITSPRSGCLYRGTGLSYNDDKQPPLVSDVCISKLVSVVRTSPRSGCLYPGTGLSYNLDNISDKEKISKGLFPHQISHQRLLERCRLMIDKKLHHAFF